jgi:hypothetical protein
LARGSESFVAKPVPEHRYTRRPAIAPGWIGKYFRMAGVGIDRDHVDSVADIQIAEI